MHYQRESKWAQQEIWDKTPHPKELHDATLLVVGFGAVGKQVARLAKALGMKIEAVTRSGTGDTTLAEKIYPTTGLDRAIPNADFIVVAAPEMPETKHMFAAPQFKAMKPSAYFINVARGSLVDDSALIQSLESRKIAGAAIDVATVEPLPPESPLWQAPNLFITPHMAGASEHLWERQTKLVIENLHRWFKGEDLINRVDFSRGY
jgi:phosphoglycerate dehydrogenase-like enzyme